MVNNPHIMVYYHCYNVIDEASQEHPDLFEKYWDTMVSMLGYKNSYHRDFALTILANLTIADHQDRFSDIFDAYFEHLNDKKFTTAECCVRNSLKIIRNKQMLTDRIIELLLDIDQYCDYPEKQKALLKCGILEICDQVYQEVHCQTRIDSFIKSQVNSVSPKTRKTARELAKKYFL